MLVEFEMLLLQVGLEGLVAHLGVDMALNLVLLHTLVMCRSFQDVHCVLRLGWCGQYLHWISLPFCSLAMDSCEVWKFKLGNIEEKKSEYHNTIMSLRFCLFYFCLQIHK